MEEPRLMRASRTAIQRRLLLAAFSAAACAVSVPCLALEQVHGFRPPDREALQVWADILRRDQDLARDARRHHFRPLRDLAVLRVDLNADGRSEMVLYANLMPFCGSAGCIIRILTRRGGNWAVACETSVEDGRGLVVDNAQTAGWRNFRATYRVTWTEDPARPARVACIEGETVERAEQGRSRTVP